MFPASVFTQDMSGSLSEGLNAPMYVEEGDEMRSSRILRIEEGVGAAMVVVVVKGKEMVCGFLRTELCILS